MAHQRREDWASQHIWQTVPVVAAGQRSAGSWIGLEQAEQEGMEVGSGMGQAPAGGFGLQFLQQSRKGGAGLLKGFDQATPDGQALVAGGADSEGVVAGLRFRDVGAGFHGR